MAPLAQCSATHAGSMVATCSSVDGLHYPTTGARQSFGETVACPFSRPQEVGYRLPLLVRSRGTRDEGAYIHSR